jgi:hypothetical protein
LLGSWFCLLAREPRFSRPAQQSQPFLHEPSQAAGVARVQAIFLRFCCGLLIRRQLRFIPSDQILDLRESEPAGHAAFLRQSL